MVGTESNDREDRLAPDEDETPTGGPADDPEDSEASPPHLSTMLERDDEPLPDTTPNGWTGPMCITSANSWSSAAVRWESSLGVS